MKERIYSFIDYLRRKWNTDMRKKTEEICY